MANEEQEVKEFNEVKVMEPTPVREDDEIIEPVEQKETAAPSSVEDKPEPDPETVPVKDDTVTEPEAEIVPDQVKIEPKPVEGESLREKALRLETSRLKGLLRDQRKDELFVKQPVASKTNEDLSEYDPEEVKRFEALAVKMGFAKKDDIIRDTVLEKNNNEFETFIEAHPEYAPENDTDGLLWNRFKGEFSLYNPPQDPKTLRKVLNKVHNEIYGIQPASNLNKINAQKEKINIASHAGKMGPKASVVDSPKAPNSNVRLDMLKGFEEDELKELGAK